MPTTSLYWHDYETFGINPRTDRPAQFAGVRTDLDLNVIDDPLVVYCKPPQDYLPCPEACLLTGITPQLAESNGVIESEFARLIYQQFAEPNTCGLGYNTLRFDDEFTRNCLYRNFYDPYAREWQNGNSRWDLIDLVRATRALRPEGIYWPVDSDGRPSFKLEELTKANTINHEAAHDALSDVYATIALAKLIKIAQPKLYQFFWQNRTKVEAFNLLQFGKYKPVVHISGRYSSLSHCLSIILPITRHPENPNGIIVYDLSIDPEPLITLSVEEIKQRVFTAKSELPENIERIALKTVHTNKCPILAPINTLRAEDQERLGIDLRVCIANIEKIKVVQGIAEKIAAVFAKTANFETETDPDLAIYSGGFFSDQDRMKITKIRQTVPDRLATIPTNFADPRLAEMLFRFRARNFPELLQPDEKKRWFEFCRARILGQVPGAGLTADDFSDKLKQLQAKQPDNAILKSLQEYLTEKVTYLQIAEYK